MNIFREEILREQRRNQRLIDLSASDGDMEKTGRLALEKRGNRSYCYEKWSETNEIRKRYLGTPDSEAAQWYLKRRMQQEMALRLEHNQKEIQGLEERYWDCGAEALLNGLPPTCRTIAEQAGVPERALMFDEEYEKVRQWAAGDWKRNEAPFTKASTYAKDGTRVRSKGECIYYNLLMEHGVINVYDCYRLFRGENGSEKWICPDFVVKCLSGMMIIIEHFGMLHDLQYSYDAGQKLHWYTLNGFVLGRNLFVTGDDAKGGTDSRAILEVVKTVEKLFYGY